MQPSLTRDFHQEETVAVLVWWARERRRVGGETEGGGRVGKCVGVGVKLGVFIITGARLRIGVRIGLGVRIRIGLGVGAGVRIGLEILEGY